MIRIIFSALVLATVVASAEIRETNFMSDALSNVKSGDVVVVDIDNTILEPVQTLGSDQWYGYVVEKYKESGMDESQAIDHAISDWVQVQKVTDVRKLEKLTPSLIKRVQAKNIMIIALTARPTSLSDTTWRQLISAGIQFKNYGYSYKDGSDIDFQNGILFVGPRNNKGIVLSKFFEQLKIKPQRLIFVDDKEKHVKNMEAVFAKSGLVNINFRYGAADERVKSFWSDLADVQWDYFQKHSGALLTDAEAEKLLPEDKLNSLSCEDARYGQDHTMSISRISQNRFNVTFVTDLDVPGGHYSHEQYLGVGSISDAKIDLKLYLNDKYVSAIQGDPKKLTAFGIQMTCR